MSNDGKYARDLVKLGGSATMRTNRNVRGSGSDQISSDFGSSGFGFRVWFSPMDFRARIPEVKFEML